MLDEAIKGRVQLKADGWFDLTLLATGDRDLAEKAWKDYVRSKQRAGQRAE